MHDWRFRLMVKPSDLDWFDENDRAPRSDRPSTTLVDFDEPRETRPSTRPRVRRSRGTRRTASVALVAVSVVALLLGFLIARGPGLLTIVGLIVSVIGAAALVQGSSRLLRTTRRSRGAFVLGIGAVLFAVGAGAFAVQDDITTRQAQPTTAPVEESVPATEPIAAATGNATVASPAPLEPTADSAGTALAALATLPVKGPAPMTGYERELQFGEAWLDVDGNGCDTRNDVLSRDLTDTTDSGCEVLSGVLRDPYSRQTIEFTRGWSTSAEVQIDHVVALADAWRTGAQQLTEQQRIDLANDPMNLFAVDGEVNQQKSDGDAATWLPPNKSFRCTYVAHQIGVKRAYDLWVTPAERDAMARVLARCANQAVPESTLVD